MNEKSKAIVIVSLIIVALSAAFLYQGYVSHSKTIDRAIAGQEDDLNSTIAALEEFSFTPYSTRIQNLLNTNPDMVEAFARRDRELLYRLSLPKYEALKKENEFFQVMHFHLPNAHTFLRMHDHDFFGDDLSSLRPIVDAVHVSRKPKAGFEVGKHGPFFRVVAPIFYENQYAGALEFGIKAHQILHNVEMKTKAEATAYFLASSWEKFTVFQGNKKEARRYGQYILVKHKNSMYEHLPRDFNLSQDEQRVVIDEKVYNIHTHPIFSDYQGQIIGGIVISQDITSLLADKKAFLRRGLFFSAILLILAFTVLYFTFGKVMDSLLHEIKERKQAEGDLALGRQRLQAIFDSSPAAIFIHDIDGTILDLNRTMLEMFKVDKEEGLTLSIADHYSSPENPTGMVSSFWQKASAGEPQRFDWIVRRPHDGSSFVAQVNLERILFGDKEVLCATLQDITARKEAEENLAAEQERLAVTLRSIADGVIATDTEGKIVLLNKVAEELTGWSHEEAQGRPSTEVFNIINELTGQQCVSPIQRVLEIGKTIGLANHTALIARDGSVRSIADSGAPIRDRESVIVGGVLVFRDVTHEKKIEEELLKIRKLESIGVLAGGIAHDFNNILSAILGNIELAAYRIGEEDIKTANLLADAQKASRRAAKLTQQLLTFSKGGVPVREATTLPEIVTDSAEFVLHGSQVFCTYSFPDELWLVDVDSGQIGQVIQNIILNAKHAMPEGGAIMIRCSNVQDAAQEALLSVDTGDYVRITIQDTGTGIPQEIRDKVFDPYFTTKEEGSGLGLAICHSIINKHDGYLSVDSVFGKGTTFTIYLPAVFSPDSRSEEKPGVVSSVRAARIMVMDDDEMVCKVAAAQLTILGHEPVLVGDGVQAINRYQELQDRGTPIDLVIMDLTIPGGMGGQEAAQKLLQLDPKAKIIVASGYSTDPVMANCREYGFCSAVAKPFDLLELSRAIESALRGD
ncbi:MAG: PAS domain S-box protein [Proteobacteria bacterium]|nr:PAS domain S-box protein [Pseudomonadota bacterium]MBU1059022.1 PAS domain S-box protein [Pseudomonadota bacterium]